MEQKDKKRALLEIKMFLTTIIMLAVLIALAGIASYVIPAGKYAESAISGSSMKVYTSIAQTPLPIWKILLSPILSLTGKNGPKIIVLLLFIFIIGGSFSIMNKSGILPRLVSDMSKRFINKRRLFIFVNVVLFAILGSCMGILEEITPMILIFIPLAISMKWDSITGVSLCFAAAGIGFAAATFNPFTIGTAQKLAELPLFSGLSLRIPVLVSTVLMFYGYLLWYTKRIEKDPSKSYVYGTDKEMKALSYYNDILLHEGNLKPSLIWMGVCFAGVISVVMGGMFVSIIQDLAFPLIALLFLLMGLGVGFFSGKKSKDVFRMFIDGLVDFSPAIILILMAAAVGYLIEAGNVMDTMLYFISQKTSHLSKESAIIMIYFFQMFMNFLVPSGTGQAILTVPIMSQLGDMLGITRQTIVLAFQFGDGFSNLIWPTNPLLMVVISLAGIKYKDWLKWMLPVQLILAVICIAFLLIAVNITY